MPSAPSVRWILTLALAMTVSAHAVPAASRTPSIPSVVAGSADEKHGLFTAGTQGATIRLVNRAELKLDPGSVARVFPVPQKLQLTGNTRTPTWSVALIKGRMDVNLPKRTQTALLVSVSDLNITTVGGTFSVLTKDHETIIASRGGEVKAQLNRRWQELKLGQVVIVDPAHPAGMSVATLGAPELLPGQSLWFATEATNIGGFKWKPVPQARAYDVRLRRTSDGAVLGTQRSQTPALAQSFSAVPPDSYAVSVRAVDARGIEGNWSAESPVRVVGVKVPPGAYMKGAHIYLGLRQRVEFENAEGIEFSHLTSGGYVPAEQGVALERDRSTIVTFRNVGSTNLSVLRLEPRQVFANVRVGPKTAIWPRDTIRIDIELKSRNGHALPSWIEPVAKVRLGHQQLDVNFARSGNVLHASVAPSQGTGPWILRVEVEDQYGVPLGRDFVEILGAPAPTKVRSNPDNSRTAQR